VLCAHQSHFCLLVTAEGRGFQIDEHETQTETLQICQAELRECHKCPTCSISMPDFAVIKGIESPMLAPAADQCVHNVTTYLENNEDNVFNEYNKHNFNKA